MSVRLKRCSDFDQVDGAMIDGVQLRVSMARRQPSFEQPADASTSSWAQIGKHLSRLMTKPAK